MNIPGMNPVVVGGGPVGGGNMMMNNTGSPAVSNVTSTSEGLKLLLNTYIYEYLLKHGHFDIARALVKDDKFDMRTMPKQSPGRRKDGEMNGADDSMDMDMKDDIPDDLPRPSHISDAGQQSSGFLFEWFAVFSDIFSAHRGQNKMAGGGTPATTYLMQHQQFQRMRETQNQNLARPNMNPNQYAMRANQMRNGMNGDVAKRFTPQQIQMMQNAQKASMQQQAMARGEQPDGDPNARPGTPADGENGGSPSKRPRLEGQQQFNAGMIANGRPAMPAGQQNMMIQAGFQPGMNPGQFRQNGGMPPKGMAAGMAAANGMNMMANASSSPMMQAMSFPEGMPPEMYPNRNAGMGQVMQGPNGQSGNHALQDYQMQLMLLEQQNKKRLMMARQEQHESTRDGGPMPGGVMPPGMSPSGNRSSPNPTDQMKRTPQMGGMPGSPSAGDMQGRSPANMGFMNGMPPQDYNAATMFMKDNQMMGGPGAPNMRPPTSVDINQMNRQQQQNRMAVQFPGGQPMAQQPSQGQPQPVGTPGQRSEMPPPTVPAANNSAQRNNQPASPANSNAPPTPSQTNKPAPKTKKTKDDGNRKRSQKKNSTANAPNSEDNPPATPTPSTPITPVNQNSFNISSAKGQAAGAQQANQAPQQGQPMPPTQQQLQQQDLGQNFPDFAGSDQNFNLDFSTLENTDVLENFDFDSFLNTSADDTFNFDGPMGVEAFNMDGTGE